MRERMVFLSVLNEVFQLPGVWQQRQYQRNVLDPPYLDKQNLQEKKLFFLQILLIDIWTA